MLGERDADLSARLGEVSVLLDLRKCRNLQFSLLLCLLVFACFTNKTSRTAAVHKNVLRVRTRNKKTKVHNVTR